jgi:hypothetical protein
MNLSKIKSRWIVFIPAITCFLLLSLMANAQGIKTTVTEILASPDKYDGKVVMVEGKASSIKEKTSKKGNAYTTFKITQKGNTLSVFTFGELTIKNGDTVRVEGKYQKVKFVPPKLTFYNEIDASRGSVEKM